MITAEEIIQRLEEAKEISKKLEEALSRGDAPVGEHWQIGITTQLARDIINFINRPCKSVDDKECKTIIKALENCIDMYTNHDNCPYSGGRCKDKLMKDVLITLKRLKEENDDLFYKLAGVMHAVDKWLDGDELEKDEVNRAAIMREKTLQITENQQAEIKVLKEIQQKVLSEQGSYTTNDKTVCSDCENLWLKTLLEQKAEIEALRISVQQLSGFLSSAKSETIKEFESKALEKAYINIDNEMIVNVSSLKAIAKEMVGDDNETN